MNIGEVSRVSGLPIKTIRYYEDMGLVTPLRQANGYRVFDESSLDKLLFLRRARKLDFSVKDCSKLLDMYENPQGSQELALAITRKHLSEVKQKIQQLKTVQTTLTQFLGSSSKKFTHQSNILSDLASAELVR